MQCPWCGYPNLAGVDWCDECGAGLQKEDVPRGTTPIEESLLGDLVAELGPRPPVCVRADTTLFDAIDRMAEHSIGCVLVTEADGTLSGILSERDLLMKVAGVLDEPSAVTVGSLMTPNPESLGFEQPLAHAIHRMVVGDHRHLPLVDDAGHAVGVISSRDIIAFVVAHLGCAGTTELQPV